MSEWENLERFLRTDPRDVGCDEAMAVLHIYVDLTATGSDAAGRYPRGSRPPDGVRPVRGGLRRAPPGGHQ